MPEATNDKIGEGTSIGFERLLDFPFYSELEEGTRNFVFQLRNSGLNTECSCHHDGYIQCQSTDPTSEIFRIKTVMLDHGVSDFTIDIHCNGLGAQFLTIRASAFCNPEKTNKEMENGKN